MPTTAGPATGTPWPATTNKVTGEPTTSAPSSTAPPAGLSTATAILVISREHVDGVSVIRDPGTLAAGEAVIAVDHPEPATHDAPRTQENAS